MRWPRFPAGATLRTAFIVVLLYHVAAPPRAAAYVDPLSGSVVLQVVVAGILGVTVGFKRVWAAIAAFIRRPFKRPGV